MIAALALALCLHAQGGPTMASMNTDERAELGKWNDYLAGAGPLPELRAAPQGVLPPPPPYAYYDDIAWVRGGALLVGYRFGDDDLEPVDEQLAFGLETFGYRRGSVGYEFGVSYSTDDETEAGIDVEVDAWEFYGGARYTWDQRRFHPYVSLGGAVLIAELEGSSAGVSVSDDDAGFGMYGRIGAWFDVARSATLGIDFRHTFASELDFFGGDVDTDFGQVSATLGWRF